ncbi:hypothetical protein [Methanolobus sp.]|jgi:uncharacterized protein YukJ|nr:hypothetical protein [Methanolobus sp.]
MQTKIRTYDTIPNDNICFLIGTILAVNELYDVHMNQGNSKKAR